MLPERADLLLGQRSRLPARAVSKIKLSKTGENWVMLFLTFPKFLIPSPTKRLNLPGVGTMKSVSHKLRAGLLELRTDHGSLYAEPSFCQRLYLVWIFRN